MGVIVNGRRYCNYDCAANAGEYDNFQMGSNNEVLRSKYIDVITKSK